MRSRNAKRALLVVRPEMKLLAFLTLLTVSGLACSGSPTTKPPSEPSSEPPASAAPSRDAALERALASIAAESDGTVAVSVLHLGNGTRASLHGDVRLPMMSVFKLPLAIVALSMIDEGKLRLDQDVPISESELRPVSPIAEAWHTGTHSVTIETLLVRTIQDSDNTAGDKLVALEGGGQAITARLRRLGIMNVDIGEQEIEMFARITCPGAARPASGWTMPAIQACPAPTKAMHLAAAQHELERAPNSATTDGLVDMLAALDGPAIPGHRDWLRDTLAGTRTGPTRLKGLLPEGTRVEHKTGTGDDVDGLNLATNDVGVITLPDASRVAIAVLIAGSRQDKASRERLIARLAKTVWDRFAR